VHDASFVRGRERVGDLRRDRDRLVHWQGTVLQFVLECLAGHQFHDERNGPALPPLLFFQSVNLRDVRVVE